MCNRIMNKLKDPSYWKDNIKNIHKSLNVKHLSILTLSHHQNCFEFQSKMSLLNDAEDVVEEVGQDLSGPPLTRFFSRYPIESKTPQKTKPQLSR